MRKSRFHTRSLVAASLAAMIAVVTPAAASAASTGAPGGARGAAAGGPGHWSQVTGAQEDIADVGLVRGADGVLHIIWVKGTAAGHQAIMDTPVGPGGAVQPTATIASGLELAEYPDATVTPSGLDAIWNGIQSDKAGSLTGTFVATRPLKGGHWSLAANVPPLPSIGYTSTSDSAATGSDGKPWVAFGGGAMVVLHLGHKETVIENKCCVSRAGLATDGVTGASWIGYLSLIIGKEGIFVQRLSQSGSSGAAALLPGTDVGGNTFPLSQRIGMTGRGHGRAGVYVSFGSGYPTYTALNVLELGAKKPVKLASFGVAGEQMAADTITTAPTGRLWVTWIDGAGSTPQLFTRVSGASGLSFGPAIHVKLPAGTNVVWKVYTSAQAGRLDIVLLATVHSTLAYFATQVLLPR